jgi:CubicO group peptidase (beta-lactamase class C family)
MTLLECTGIAVLLAFGIVSRKASAQEWDSPVWPGKEWTTSTPEEQGVDPGYLVKMLEYIREKKSPVHSLTVIRHGRMIFDASFWPYDGASLHDIASVTKSITSALAGIAADQGYIRDIHSPVIEYFPHRGAANLDKRKLALTVEHLLTMTTGLHGGEPAETTLLRMVGSPDWVQFMLDHPMAVEPGKEFAYSSGGAHLLSAIIRETTGRRAMDFAQTNLFDPLGISRLAWPSDHAGNNHGFGSLCLHPHDMARFGYLYLRGGVWNGKQVISKEWVAASTRKQSAPPDSSGRERGYGYLWWVFPGYFLASGRGGQCIFVCPETDLVMVTTGGGFNSGELFQKFVAPATSGRPLPPNQQAADRLQILLKAAQEPPMPEPASPLPAIAREISGKRYGLGSNWTQWSDFTLVFEGQREALLRMSWYGVPCEYRVGLDGTWKTGAGKHGIPAVALGEWKSETQFDISLNEGGNIGLWRITFDFAGGSVTVKTSGATGLPGFTVQGKREDNPKVE